MNTEIISKLSEALEALKNGKTVESATYTSQPEKKDFTYSYRIDASEGDVIEATVTCNFFGSKSATLTILPAAAKAK